MSPLMFSFFIEDLELYLQNDINVGVQLDDILLMLLLFADDMAILAPSPKDLRCFDTAEVSVTGVKFYKQTTSS